MLHDAIQHIRKPLEYSAKNHFAHIDRLRELERTVASWVEQQGNSAALLAHQQELLLKFRQLFRDYDRKNRTEKITIIQQGFQLLERLEHERSPQIPPGSPLEKGETEGGPPSEKERTEGDPPLEKWEKGEIFPFKKGREEEENVPPLPKEGGGGISVTPPPHTQYDLSEQIQFVRGVGPKRARLLNKLGIHSIEEALFFFPRRFEDRRRIQKIAQLRPGNELRTVFGTVKSCGVSITSKRRSKIFELMIGDETGQFTAKWFNQAYLKKVFKPGKQVVLSGKISMKRYGGLEMVQPEYEILDRGDREDELLHTGRIVPVYPLTDGLYQKDLRKIMKGIVDRYGTALEENLPDDIRQRHQLLPLSEALARIHFPDNSDNIDLLNAEKSPAHWRMIFDEFFLLELGMGLKRHHLQAHERGISFRFEGILEKYLRESLPFSLTSAQNRVTSEIQKNMRSSRVMNRLLQGDVGSGKTLVALIALLSAVEAGYQGAIMVPTEILAEQHFRKIFEDLRSLNEFIAQKGDKGLGKLREAQQPDLYSSTRSDRINASLLTGGMKKREREEQLRQIERGEIDIVVGTHALLQHDVNFHKLGLVVIDEQHKFGVMQRAGLKAKGYNPDVLIMTATPIPRTLSLTMYGDLDVSILDELPPGRTPVITQRFYEKNRERAYRLIQREIEHGRQVYIVYPLVEESEKLDLKAATEMSQHLAQDIFPQYKIGLVHGRMKGVEKEEQMQAFKEQQLHILVSTTVLEVGIDVPNATVMLIEHAERFGLSQLHQLRGRVGRGGKQSYCMLMTSYPMSNEARQRLDAMVESTDGFVIAERDLEIRGPGEFFGTKQSGLPDLNVANLIRDIRLLEEAREEAFSIIRQDPGLTLPQHRPIKNALEQRWKKSLDLISIG